MLSNVRTWAAAIVLSGFVSLAAGPAKAGGVVINFAEAFRSANLMTGESYVVPEIREQAERQLASMTPAQVENLHALHDAITKYTEAIFPTFVESYRDRITSGDHRLVEEALKEGFLVTTVIIRALSGPEDEFQEEVFSALINRNPIYTPNEVITLRDFILTGGGRIPPYSPLPIGHIVSEWQMVAGATAYLGSVLDVAAKRESPVLYVNDLPCDPGEWVTQTADWLNGLASDPESLARLVNSVTERFAE